MAMNNYALLHEKFQEFMSGYAEAYERATFSDDRKNPFREIVSKEIPDLLRKCCAIDDTYSVVGSYGKGRWTTVPWIAVFDKRITTSALSGVYIVYLLNKDTKDLYLTLAQGATTVIKEDVDQTDSRPTFTGVTGSSSKRNLEKLKGNAKIIRDQLGETIFLDDDKVNTGSVNYDASVIYYKKYSLETLPSGEDLTNDLVNMMNVYQKYFELLKNEKHGVVEKWTPSKEEYDPGFSKEDWLTILKDPEIIGPIWGGTLAMFYAQGGAATCSQLGDIYGRTPFGISGNCTQLAMCIHKKTKCSLYIEDGKEKYWPILFVGRNATPDEKGNFVWKLRDELYDAITESDIMKYLPSKSEGPEETMNISTKDAVNHIKSYIASQGFTYNDGLIENFYLSLKSKPFVILAGTSGTGKTRLVKLFAEAINAEYKMVPVRPDWSDSSDLFGHVNLSEKYVPGAILEFIAEANSNPGKPYILCLDEMNLARVEYYLSDFLSVIETRDFKDGRIISDPLVSLEKYGVDTAAAEKYGELRFPQNLYLVGTVNMDETTFPFSKKVLDRANTIEFNYVDLTSEIHEEGEVDTLRLPNTFLEAKFLLFAQCKEDKSYVDSISEKLQKLNEILQKANAHVGYRVRDEIVFYMLNNKESGLLSEDEAFDNEIMQKILPRIQGSSSAIKEMLCALFKEFAGDFDGFQTNSNDTAENMEKKLAKDGARYPKSANKVMFMVRRFEEDGFTSYWL
jgi:MoxR-like ATPase